MNEGNKKRLHHFGMSLLGTGVLLLLGGALLAWSWNTFVAELFGTLQMSFRQAVAAEVLVGIVSAIAARSARARRHRPPYRARRALP
jgi:hypothetical protein